MRNARVLVLGGGFGGVYTAPELERLQRAGAAIEITLAVTHSFDRHAHELEYDHLVIAPARSRISTACRVSRRIRTMKTLGDAMHLRNRVIATLEEADTECSRSDDGLLTFVVTGGGFAGVETLGAVNDFVRDGLRYSPRLKDRAIRMVLIHAGPEILPELGDTLGAYARKKLLGRGVEVVTGARVTEVAPQGVHLADGRFIASRLVVWTAGTSPHPLLGRLRCETVRARLVVDETLRAPGQPVLWGVGACAIVPDRRTGKPFPPTAQHAIREAETVARNIVAVVEGGRVRPFEFRTLGQLAAIGRRTGVARIFGVSFSGFLAWWLWRTIYLGKLPRIEKKIRVALDWTPDLLFSKDFVQFLTVRGPVVSDHPLNVTEPLPDVPVPASRR